MRLADTLKKLVQGYENQVGGAIAEVRPQLKEIVQGILRREAERGETEAIIQAGFLQPLQTGSGVKESDLLAVTSRWLRDEEGLRVCPRIADGYIKVFWK